VAGAGDDRVEIVMAPPTRTHPITKMTLDIDLGAGNDAANFRYAGTPSAVGLAGELSVRIRGGAGSDLIQTDILFPPPHPCFLEIDAGEGDDLIAIRWQGNTSESGPPQTLHIHAHGGSGNDDFSLFVMTSRPSAMLDLLLDGGPGFDICFATPNVQVTRCEDHSPSPTPDD
jgi:hypothetical protein